MNPPANWYPDPTGRHGQRYWDGEQWTEHVFTDGVQAVDPLDVADGDSDVETTAGVASETSSKQSPTATAERAPAELPRRQPAAPATSDSEQMDSPVESADGLFAESATPVDEVETAVPPASPEATTWTPDDEGSEEQAADAESTDVEVAPEVEPDDVVANVDEVADSGGSDFSDAFVLAPETASRLVRRGQGTDDAEPTPDEDGSADADAHDAAEETAAVESQDVPAEPLDESATAASSTDMSVDAEEPHAEEPHADADAEEPDAEEDGPGGAGREPGAAEQVPVDAPPPAMPAPSTASAGLGITGDLVGGAFAEREGGGDVSLQNSRMLRCAASGGIIARQGTMVAYQGDVSFERQGAGGVGRALKRAATGEGLAMMRVSGRGDVFFADGGQHVFLLHLDGGPGLSVNGRNVLAFSAALQWDIERVKGASLLAGGLFNTTLTGTGWVALVADGEPVVLRTDEAPTYVDVNALVAWSGGLSTSIVNTISARSLVGLGSGEAFQMAFDGAGIVIVQPSEGPMGGAAAS